MWPVLASVFGIGGALYFGIKYIAPWILEDVKFMRGMSRALSPVLNDIKKKRFFIDIFESTVSKCPEKVMFWFEGKSFTFKEVEERANQCGHAFLEQGVKPGDVVALMMQNEPPFIWIYLGLLKIGAQTAFINFHQRHKTLIHSIKSCDAQILIVGNDSELTEAVIEIQNEIGQVRILTYSSKDSIPNSVPLIPFLEKASASTLDKSHRAGVEMSDASVYIFTSGTTGLPKAAIVTHVKTIKTCYGMCAVGISGEDILYETLPMYHSAAGLIGLGHVVTFGATMVLKKKFSASQFLEDCRKYKVTVIHYVGELCRYLVSRPKRDDDGDHCIKFAFGNGLRKDIWKEMQTRFKIPVIAEFYGATEMPIGLINLTNKFGAVGRASPLIQLLIAIDFVKYDMEEQNVIRNKNGFAIRAAIGEPGLLLIKLDEKKNLTFEGYKGQADENSRKILHDVFQKGDQYINTGDLFVRDKEYDLFFCDRVGDTFRWKGENVSTTEVSNILSELDFIMDANVYGVFVHGCEGRAGMAALVLKDSGGTSLTTDQLRTIADHCNLQLGAYAWPRFLRVLPELEVTSTYKQRKMALVKDGFDPVKVKSPIYFLDCRLKMYKEMDKESYEAICNGKIGL